MPRPKRNNIFTRDDLEAMKIGNITGLIDKIIEWARREIMRQDKCGQLGGRPKKEETK